MKIGYEQTFRCDSLKIKKWNLFPITKTSTQKKQLDVDFQQESKTTAEFKTSSRKHIVDNTGMGDTFEEKRDLLGALIEVIISCMFLGTKKKKHKLCVN